MAKPDYKRFGFIPQRQQDYLIMRVRNRAGNMTAEGLRQLADLAERYGDGQVHVTTRQAVEIPGVKEELFEEALQAIRDAGLLPAVCGPRMRPVVACPGTDSCPYGLRTTRILAEKLDAQFVTKDLPAKTKIAISGCPNSCTKPQGNDIGFKGVVEPLIHHEACVTCGACVRRCPSKAMRIEDGTLHIDDTKCLSCGVCIRLCPQKALHPGRKGYHIYVGGKGGRYSSEGELLAPFVEEEQVIPYLEAILLAYEEMATKGERLHFLLMKTGLPNFKQKVAEEMAK